MSTARAKSGAVKRRTSAGAPVARRSVNHMTRLLLFVHAGGRCEFSGCNRYLLEHHLTLREGNFAQVAHVVAFSAAGPRGRARRPAAVDALPNLMLLCPACHKEIDDCPSGFSVASLKTQKREHEKRIRELTKVKPDMQTVILQLRARIGGQFVDIPAQRVREAIAPRYAADKRGHTIDVEALSTESSAFYKVAEQQIRNDVGQTIRGFELLQQRHVSVFALAPIPLLVVFGHALGDKVTVDLYQRHRDTQSWKWKSGGITAAYHTVLRRGVATNSKAPVLVLSLSGQVTRDSWPTQIDESRPVYELTLDGAEAHREFLRTREDLLAFSRAYAAALARIMADNPGCKALEVLAAVPAPVAIALGRELLPKVHPELRIYDNIGGRFRYCLSVNGSATRR